MYHLIDLGYSNPDLTVAEALAMVRLNGYLGDDESFEVGCRVAFALAIYVEKSDRVQKI